MLRSVTAVPGDRSGRYAVHRGTWYGRPGSVRLRARPSSPSLPGRGCHCQRPTARGNVRPTPTRDRTGGHLGCRSRNQGRTSDFEADSDRWISNLDHEPSNWTSANRPGGPSGRQRLSRIHQRLDRPPVSEGDCAFRRPSAGSGGSSVTLHGRMRSTSDATPVQVRLDDSSG